MIRGPGRIQMRFILVCLGVLWANQTLFALDLQPPPGEYRTAQLIRLEDRGGWEYRISGSEDQRFRPVPQELLLDSPSGSRWTWTIEFRRGSDSRTETWMIDRQAPESPRLTIDPRDGTVTIAAPESVQIEYRVGNGPLGSATGTTVLGVGQFGLPAVVTARSIDPAGNPSEAVSADLDQRDFFQSALRIVSPVEGRFANRQALVLDGSSLVSAEYSYTLRRPDGTSSSSSGAYTGPVLLPSGTVDLEVRALGLDGRSHSERIRFTAREAQENWIPDAAIPRILDLPNGYLYAAGDSVPPAGSEQGPRLLNGSEFANDRGISVISARRSGTAEWLRFVLLVPDARQELRPGEILIRAPRAGALSPLGDRPLGVDAADGALLEYSRNGEVLPQELAAGLVGIPEAGDIVSLSVRWRDLVSGAIIAEDSRDLDIVRGRPDPPELAATALSRSFVPEQLNATVSPDTTLELRIVPQDGVPQNWVAAEQFATFVPPSAFRGRLRIEARALDRAGIPSDSAAAQLTLDNAAPSPPVIRLEPGQAVVEGEDTVWVSIEDLATSLVLAPLGPVDGPIDITTLPASEAVIAAWTVDDAGNRSQTVRSEPLIRDDSLPRLPALEGLPAALQSQAVLLRLPERAAGIRVLYELREGGAAPGPDENSEIISDELVIPGRPGEDLEYSLALRAQETGISRRLGPVTRYSFRIDREPPPSPILESAVPARSRRPETLVVRAADQEFPVFYEVRENGETSEQGRLGGVLRFAGRPLREITYTVLLYSQDPAGNRSDPLGPISVTIDRVGPGIEVVEPARLGLRDTLQVSAPGADRIFVDIEPEQNPERWERRVVEGSAGSVILPEEGGPFLVRAQAADELGNVGEPSAVLRVPRFRPGDDPAAELSAQRQTGPQIDVVLPRDSDAFASPVSVQLVSSAGEELRYRISEGGSPEAVRPDDPVYQGTIELPGRENDRVRYWVSVRGASGTVASRSVVVDQRSPEEPEVPGLDFAIVGPQVRRFPTSLVGDWEFRVTPVAGPGTVAVTREGQELELRPSDALEILELEIESQDRFGRRSSPVRAVVAALPQGSFTLISAGDQRRLADLQGSGSLAVLGTQSAGDSPRLMLATADISGSLVVSDLELVVNGTVALQATEALLLRNLVVTGTGELLLEAPAVYASNLDLGRFNGSFVVTGAGGRMVDLSAEMETGSLVFRRFSDLELSGLTAQSGEGENPVVLIDGARVRAFDSRITSLSRSNGTALEVRDGEFTGDRTRLEGAPGSFVSRAMVLTNSVATLRESLIQVAGRGTAVGLIAANSEVSLTDTEIRSVDNAAESVVALNLRDSTLTASRITVTPAGASDATAIFLRDTDADISDSHIMLPEATTTRGVAILGTGSVEIRNSEILARNPGTQTQPVAISASGSEMRVGVRGTGIGEGLTAWRRSVPGIGTVFESRTADQLAETDDPVLDASDLYPALPDS